MTHFILRSDKTSVHEFLAFRVHPTGEVDARTSFLNVPTFARYTGICFQLQHRSGSDIPLVTRWRRCGRDGDQAP
jgi:hypothetical protein